LNILAEAQSALELGRTLHLADIGVAEDPYDRFEKSARGSCRRQRRDRERFDPRVVFFDVRVSIESIRDDGE
jgi:hypothetical protein